MRTLAPLKAPFFTLLVCLVTAATLSGCGKDSVADQVTRQKDRERENASTVSNEYDTVSGNYGGVLESSSISGVSNRSSLAHEDYDVTANLKTTRVHRDANLIPQPVISGSIVLTSKVRKLRSGAPMHTFFSFSNGSYDSATRQLSIEIMSVQGTPAIEVNCKRSSAEDTIFHCLWLSLISDVRMEFDLKPAAGN